MKRISGWRVSHCMQEIILLWTWNVGKKSISQTTIHKRIQNTGIHKTQKRLSEHLYYTFPPPPTPPPLSKKPEQTLTSWQKRKYHNGSLSHFPDSIIFWLCLLQFFSSPSSSYMSNILFTCMYKSYLFVRYSIFTKFYILHQITHSWWVTL